MSWKTALRILLFTTLVGSGPLWTSVVEAGIFDPPPAYPVPPAAYPTSPANTPQGGPLPGYPESRYSRFVNPAYDWTGFYIGVSGGIDWSLASWTSPQDAMTGTSASVLAPFVGGTVGYNAQTIGAFVYGVEFDFDWRKPKAIVISPSSCAPNCELDRAWFATGRIRFGYAIDRFMPFITGGVALADERSAIAGHPFGVQRDLGIGLTGGGGVEFGLIGPLSGKIEYLYARYAGINCNSACGAGPAFGAAPLRTTPSESIVRAGFNYRLWER